MKGNKCLVEGCDNEPIRLFFCKDCISQKEGSLRRRLRAIIEMGRNSFRVNNGINFNASTGDKNDR